MPLNPSINKIVPGGGAPLVNYNYTDIIAGTGVITLYFGNTQTDSTTSGAVLTNKVFSSDYIITGVASGAAGGYGEMQNKTYSVQFNKPTTIDGEMITNIASGIRGGEAGTFYSRIHLDVIKWDGTSETTLSSASGAMFTHGAAGAQDYGYCIDGISNTIARTKFGVGDELRIKITQYGDASNASGDWMFATDPANRGTSGKEPVIGQSLTWGTATSQSVSYIPVLLDLP